MILLAMACASSPPRRPGDLCAIFDEKDGWYEAARRSRERWGVSEGLQVAVIYQESRFRAEARPPRRTILWIFPGPRPSSAYGYGQVIDSTWAGYRRATGRRGADRDDFADVTDFIGWYGSRIAQRTGIPLHDARLLYLAYHEGPGGFLRGTHRSKAWLQRVAQEVAARARRYDAQLAGCRADLERGGWWFW